MSTFTLIRTYSCRRSTGYVYEISGQRAASLAKSLEGLKASLGVVDAPLAPVIEGTQRSVWACDRRQDARRVGTTQLTFERDADGYEWMVAVVLTKVGELRTASTREAAPGQARFFYPVEYRAATAQEIADLDEPGWLKSRIGKRKV